MKELTAKYSRSTVTAACTRLIELAEMRLRAAIAEWKDGVYEAERFVDDDGVELNKPVRVHVRV